MTKKNIPSTFVYTDAVKFMILSIWNRFTRIEIIPDNRLAWTNEMQMV